MHIRTYTCTNAILQDSTVEHSLGCFSASEVATLAETAAEVSETKADAICSCTYVFIYVYTS